MILQFDKLHYDFSKPQLIKWLLSLAIIDVFKRDGFKPNVKIFKQNMFFLIIILCI